MAARVAGLAVALLPLVAAPSGVVPEGASVAVAPGVSTEPRGVRPAALGPLGGGPAEAVAFADTLESGDSVDARRDGPAAPGTVRIEGGAVRVVQD